MITPTYTNPWIVCPRPNPGARLRLFCFPYAGGGASVYREWPACFQRDIEVYSIQLPGRENRIKETFIKDLFQVVSALKLQLLPLLDRPFALFGYSMGALISFEIARSLRDSEGLLPEHLFVAAHRAPHLPDPNPPLHTLSRSLLIEKLRQLQGTPEEFFQEPEIVELLLPLLRADFMICETYTYSSQSERLPCPITAFGGRKDSISPLEIQAWEHETTGAFTCHMLADGHFFLRSEKSQLLTLLSKALQACIN